MFYQPKCLIVPFVADLSRTVKFSEYNFRVCILRWEITALFPVCLRLMWSLCVRRPAGQKRESKSGSGGGGTRSVQGFASGSAKPGVYDRCVLVCTLMWEQVCRMYSMCNHVTLLFSSVYSWRCVFYLFAFVYGVLALYDVSSIGLFPSFWFMVCPLCQPVFPLQKAFLGLLSICLVSLCAACETLCLSSHLMALGASGFSHILPGHVADWHAWTCGQDCHFFHFTFSLIPPSLFIFDCRNLGSIIWRRFGQASLNR